MKKRHIIYGSLLMFINSSLIRCNTIDKKAIKNDFCKCDSIKKDIPRDKNGKYSKQYLLKDSTEIQAGFKSLEEGFDSLAIRIWYGGAINPIDQIVEITNSHSQWKAQLFLVEYGFNKPSYTLSSIKKTIIERTPKSGWKDFISKIIDLKILTLPSDNTLAGYNYPTDSNGASIEVATKNEYRIYFYSSPDLNSDNFWQAKNVEVLMDLIEYEFDFKRVE